MSCFVHFYYRSVCLVRMSYVSKRSSSSLKVDGVKGRSHYWWFSRTNGPNTTYIEGKVSRKFTKQLEEYFETCPPFTIKRLICVTWTDRYRSPINIQTLRLFYGH